MMPFGANRPLAQAATRAATLGVLLFTGFGVITPGVNAAYQHDFGYNSTAQTYTFTSMSTKPNIPSVWATCSETWRDPCAQNAT